MHYCSVCQYMTSSSNKIKTHYNTQKHIINNITDTITKSINDDNNDTNTKTINNDNNDDNGSEYVYCCSNPSYQDLLKIGRTAKYPTIRALSLFKTSVPTPFKIEFIISTKESVKLESKIHTYLKDYRLSKNREFFKISVDELKKILINQMNLKLTYDISDIKDSPPKKQVCNKNKNNSFTNDKIIELKKDFKHKLEIEKLKNEYEAKLKNEQELKLKNEYEAKLKSEYEHKLEIEKLKLEYELKLKNQECENLKQITNSNSNNNNKITNNITNINMPKLDFLNSHFCNVLNIDDFIENYKNNYCLSQEETQTLLDNFLIKSMYNSIDTLIKNLFVYLQKKAHKMYKDFKGQELNIDEVILPIILVDGSARSHYEKNATKWVITTSIDKLKIIYDITNEQIYKHHNKYLDYNGFREKKIQMGILKENNYTRLYKLKTCDFYKK